MAASYAHARIPEPYTILGLSLRPFGLGHYLLMRRFDCGFADGNNYANPSELVRDFLLALVICSMSYEGFLEVIATDKLPYSKKGLFGYKEKTVSFRKFLADWGATIAKASRKADFNLFEKLALFKDYREIHVPKYWEGDSDGEPSGAHWSQSILLILTGELGYSHSEALNSPLSQTMADYFRFLERNGVIQLMSEEESAQVEAANGTR